MKKKPVLEEHCNFTDFSKWVCKVYWEIQPYITFNSQNDNSVEGWIKFLGKHYKGEKYLESIANVIINNEPRVKDIENEFWMNCTDVLSIDSFCNIYRERWRNHLYCIKETDFDMDAMLFDDKINDFGIYGTLCNKLFKKDILMSVFNDIDKRVFYGEDCLVLYSYIMRISSIYILREAFYHYNIHENSVCTTPDERLSVNSCYLYKGLQSVFMENEKYKYILLRQLKRYILNIELHNMEQLYGISSFTLGTYKYDYESLKNKKIIINTVLIRKIRVYFFQILL